MFGFSFFEFLVVIFAIIILFKPKEIISFLQSLVEWQEKLKNEIENAKAELTLLSEEEVKEGVIDEFTNGR
jgi:Sec-independent protein translocase protein TatA